MHQHIRAAGGKLAARFFVFGSALLLAACGAAEPGLSYSDGVVRASGWSGPAPAEGWDSVLVVRTSDDDSAPAMLGEYAEQGGVVTFTPRFAPTPGVPLHATFHVKHSTLEATFGEPAKPLAATTTVAHLYPSTDQWPENTLKMYLTFSAPMATGEAYEHIRVLDDQGRAIIEPFVEIDQELWDASGTRLTVLFDPGRIKRGLVDNEESGPPLVAGRQVTIEIDPSWRDATGAPLAAKFSRTISVSEAVRDVVRPDRWTVEAPRAGDADLVVRFDRPLDHALAQRAISVTRDGGRLSGRVALEDDERVWRFTPDQAWASGDYFIAVDGVLEDLAGNRPGKAFDVDTM
ncbi:MAG: hypothetical protein EOP61_25775, partial [Sphingomonadales bacterium]